MGIKYDRGSVRPTNGPMLFFSDPSSEISISEEIRGSIRSRLAFYAYRLPGDLMFTYGSSERVTEGIGVPGFVAARFDPSLPYLTIPYKPISGSAPQVAAAGDARNGDSEARKEFRTTTPKEHRAEIDAIKEALKENGGGKIVAARIIVDQGSIDLGATFSQLCREYPDAFVFCFSTPLTGCWIGASPELLLRSGTDGSVETMALAGTRPAYSEFPWDHKNIEEQAMVTQYIEDCLRNNGLAYNLGITFTKQAGEIEHICTPVSTTSAISSPEKLESLLKALSPTPALCGLPRELALRVIKENEHFIRGCYGGFCGPYRSPSDFDFYVNLRSARIEEEREIRYVGSGITLLSDPSAEWEETEAKSRTLALGIR